MNKLINTSSKKRSTREGFGEGLLESARKDNKVVGLCADLTESLKMTKFSEEFHDRFIQVGVAEQNLIGTAAGLAMTGKTPFAASFASFNPGRNWDQIRVSVCYSNLNVKIVGGHAGLTTGQDGATHQSLEDIAVTRVLPNMTVVVPANFAQAKQATLALAQHKGPAYLRLGREKVFNFLKEEPFKIGEAQVLHLGTDVTIITCGEMVEESIFACEQLAREKISATLINMHTIKPIDKKAIIDAANKTQAIVTVENHQIHGGLGSAVSEVLSMEQGNKISKPTAMEMVAVQDTFGESGLSRELLDKYKINSHNIVQRVHKVLKKKSAYAKL